MLLVIDMQPQNTQQPMNKEVYYTPTPVSNNQPAIPVCNQPQGQQVFPSLETLQSSYYAQQPYPANQYPSSVEQPQSYPVTVVYNQQPSPAGQAPIPAQQTPSLVPQNLGMPQDQNTQQMTPTMAGPIPKTGADVLLAPDQAYFAPNPVANGASPFPLYQAPKGNPVEVKVEVKNEATKQRNTMIGLGVGAGAMLLTGGLALPVVAGVVAYNLLKDDGCARYSAYKNTYVYELRAAIARDLNIRPEFILLMRKKVAMDDNEIVQKYMSKPDKMKITVSILNVPAVGSNYHLTNGGVYPPVQSVCLTKPFKKCSVC